MLFCHGTLSIRSDIFYLVSLFFFCSLIFFPVPCSYYVFGADASMLSGMKKIFKKFSTKMKQKNLIFNSSQPARSDWMILQAKERAKWKIMSSAVTDAEPSGHISSRYVKKCFVTWRAFLPESCTKIIAVSLQRQLVTHGYWKYFYKHSTDKNTAVAKRYDYL